MIPKLRKLIKDEEGLTTIEYAVSGALIVAAMISAFTALGGAVCDVIDNLTGLLGGTVGVC